MAVVILLNKPAVLEQLYVKSEQEQGLFFTIRTKTNSGYQYNHQHIHRNGMCS